MSIQTKERLHLQGGQYLLVRPLERSAWSETLSEVWWLGRTTPAHDGQGLTATEHLLAEVRVSVTGAALTRQLQPMLRTLLAIQGHPQHLHLQDMFSEHASHYFVFAQPQGQPLAALMQAGTLLEEDVRLCCLSVIEALHAFARIQMSNGIVSTAHGGITPHHLLFNSSPSGPRWIVSQPSLLLASGALDARGASPLSSSLFPYYPPEFEDQGGDIRADLYALLACAYHALTKTHPARQRQEGGAIPQVQWLNIHVSSRMNEILVRGLHPHPEERYQHPTELYVALGGELGTLEAQQRRVLVAAQSPTYQRQAVAVGAGVSWKPSGLHPQSGASSEHAKGWPIPLTFGPAEPETKSFLPRPESLPPFPAAHEWQAALCWLGGITVLEAALLMLAQ